MDKNKRKKILEKIKRDKYGKRLLLPPHKVHKTVKDYKRKNKVKVYEPEEH